MIKKILFICVLFVGFLSSLALAQDPKSVGKYKNWETFVYTDGKGKVCFAQTKPLERAPKNFKREPSRLFVTFRKFEKIKNEISITSGHEYKSASVTAKLTLSPSDDPHPYKKTIKEYKNDKFLINPKVFCKRRPIDSSLKLIGPT